MYGFSHGRRAADAAAVARVELDELQHREAARLDLVEHADHVFNAVRRQVPVVEHADASPPVLAQLMPIMPVWLAASGALLRFMAGSRRK